ncbi:MULTISPECIES: hypothetical protein [Methylobacteriaceae]|uniref:hypothetical protein n=1 Tax=Methylobacteriaceae TaxID=119045 RepID=UPI0011BEB6F3|nr:MULTISPECIES: hypothetical protein [Methylobacteriaceae]
MPNMEDADMRLGGRIQTALRRVDNAEEWLGRLFVINPNVPNFDAVEADRKAGLDTARTTLNNALRKVRICDDSPGFILALVVGERIDRGGMDAWMTRLKSLGIKPPATDWLEAYRGKVKTGTTEADDAIARNLLGREDALIAEARVRNRTPAPAAVA